MVEIHLPPNFHAAAPARIPLNGPSIDNPPAQYIFSDNFQSSVCRRVDEHISPRGRDFEFVDPVQVGFRQPTAGRPVAKPSLGTAESTYADVLETFKVCHWRRDDFLTRNEICLRIGVYSDIGQSRKVNLSKRINPRHNNLENWKPVMYDVIWCGALIRSKK